MLSRRSWLSIYEHLWQLLRVVGALRSPKTVYSLQNFDSSLVFELRRFDGSPRKK